MTCATLSPRARDDLLDAVRWIAKENRLAAQALRNAVSTAANRIGAYPEIGTLRREFADPPYRFLALTGFPYVIVYNAERVPPRIVRVLHGARDIPDVLMG